MSDSIDGLKQRLVGAFVILTLAIIFLPMIFDKPHNIGSSTISPVPPRPDFQTVVVEKPSKPGFEMVEVDPASEKVTLNKALDTKPVPVSASKPLAKKEAPAKQAPSTSTKKTSPSPTRVSDMAVFKNVWMVQLGTFSDAENAYRLRDRLRNDGFKSHTKPLDIKGKPAIRVFSGPFVSKLEAQKVKKKLDARYKVKSLVLFFDP